MAQTLPVSVDVMKERVAELDAAIEALIEARNALSWEGAVRLVPDSRKGR